VTITIMDMDNACYAETTGGIPTPPTFGSAGFNSTGFLLRWLSTPQCRTLVHPASVQGAVVGDVGAPPVLGDVGVAVLVGVAAGIGSLPGSSPSVEPIVP
jgi:hypothetical protein